MNSNTYCQLCDKECGKGTNWSSHVGSAKHLKKVDAAPSQKVVMMFDSDDDFEDFEGPRAQSTPITPTLNQSCSIWNTPSINLAPKIIPAPQIQAANIAPKAIPPPTIFKPTPQVVRPSPWAGMMASRLIIDAVLPQPPKIASNADFPPIAARQLINLTPTVVAPTSLTPIPPRPTHKGDSFITIPIRKRPAVVAQVPMALKGAVAQVVHETPTRASPPRNKTSIHQHRKYKCERCESMIDSMANLNMHRGGKKCKALEAALRPLMVSSLTNSNISEPQNVHLEAIEPVINPQRLVDYTIDIDETASEDELVRRIDKQTTPTVTSLRESTAAESSDEYTCGQCGTIFVTLAFLRTHRQGCHPDNLPHGREMCDDFQCASCSLTPVRSAMNGVLRSISITPTEQSITADQFILNTREGIQHVLQHCLANGERLKVFQ